MKEFKPTSWAVDHKIAVFILTILITGAGLISYNNLPKENFPDIVLPTIFVNTIYPGASPLDMEELVTKPIEKQIKGINGVKKVTSNSVQDFSSIIVEFNTDVEVAEAKIKVKDAVDKAKRDLPTDLLDDPTVAEMEFSEMPVMFINLSGDFSLTKLKDYAELLQDDIEELKEITRVDIVGALEKEIQVDVDKYRMAAASLSFMDIENAIAFENMTISAGNVTMDGMARTVAIRGDFTDVEQIKNIVVTSQSGAQMYLKDVADVRFGFEEQESFSRLDGNNVITLNVIKRGGENLIEASEKIAEIVKKRQAEDFPAELELVTTGDQSKATRTSLHELINTIVIGFLLVAIILMFFMGATNAIFVALSIPLSMCIAFLVLPTVGFTINMIVLFAFLLGLGIVVDDAVVVIENTHRIHNEHEPDINKATKMAAGEVFIPVIAGTATTLAPFIPLAFWEGIMGKFIIYLPITLIITLSASLFVAYIINPVFAASFMKRDHEDDDKQTSYKGLIISSIILLVSAAVFHMGDSPAMGNLALVSLAFLVLYRFLLSKAVKWFQERGWPKLQNAYASFLRLALRFPGLTMLGTLLIFVFSIFMTMASSPKVIFFPEADPNFVYTYINMPIGTDVHVTDSITKIVENRVMEVIGENNPIVESVISNVALGAAEDQMDQGISANKGKVGVAFIEYAKRNGQSSKVYLDKIRDAVQGIPGAEVVVAQEAAGPPTGKPVAIEIRGENFQDLIRVSTDVKRYLDSINISGIEELRSDLIVSKPEIRIDIDRERANREGISTAQIGSEFRTAILGKEASKFKDGEDEVPIVVRLKKDQRENINAVENLNITFRDMNMGGVLRSVPMAAFADVEYTNTYGGIRRKNQSRMVTISSNLAGENANANEIVAQVQNALKLFPKPDGVTIGMGGEQEEQEATATFLSGALMTSLLIIFLILILQFNSFGKTIIILTEVIFSIIGVLLGLSLFGMDFSIFMMGIGIVTLAGIVVKNGILLVEFTDQLRAEGYEVTKAVVEAGKIRMTPVLLTATATIMGMFPLAIGFNIDFLSLLETGDPKIFFGGDSVAFWSPLSWTIIFGLAFSTIITLIILPVMYKIGHDVWYWGVRLVTGIDQTTKGKVGSLDKE